MKKDFTIEAEVRLFAHWTTSDTPEEKEAVNDRLGAIAARLDEVVRVLVEEQIKNGIDASDNVQVNRTEVYVNVLKDIHNQLA